MLFIIKLILIAVILSTSVFLWALPGLSAGQIPPWQALLGVMAITALPVMIVHYLWIFFVNKKPKGMR